MRLIMILICLLLFITTCFSQKLGKYTLEEWQTVIDTTWGEGLPTEDKLQIFDMYWNAVDDNYAGFINLDVNWDSLYTVYRPEVETGVSRGRFAAIMNQLVMALMEIHTHCNDVGVRGDSLLPGVPLMAYGSAYSVADHGHFGACLTALPDSSALVYKVVDNHPLGLELGDIILGYDGVPWKYLYQELLAVELPITFPNYISVGSSERSVSHMWLMSAGLNWHLFDTIDILKYSSNDTVHLPTSNLINQNMHVYGSESIQVPGVPMIDLSQFGVAPMVSWGIVDGTQIGYIYVSRWSLLEEQAFTNAVNGIINDYQTTGLILDFRVNPGGQSDRAFGGFSRLFNSNLNIYEMSKRSDPTDHFAMVSIPSRYEYVTPDTYLYDRPIAVLTGPITFSAGEYNAHRLKFHPMTRSFGKPTNTGFTNYNFNSPQNVSMPFAGWEAGYAPENASLHTDPGNYLMHVGFEVDEEVWLTPEDVAKGEDTVVKRAIEWINTLAHAHDVIVDKNYIKPVIDEVTISAEVENPNNHTLSVLAYILINDTTVVDSVYLSKEIADGNSIWEASWSTSDENIYHVSVKTDNIDAGKSRTIPNVAHFTSTGPVVIDQIYVTGNDTIVNPGDSNIKFDIFLRNESTADTIKNVTINPVLLNPCTKIASFALPVFNDIAPGESKKGSRQLGIGFADSCNGGAIDFALEIMSDDIVFWTDTFQVVVGLEDVKSELPIEFALKQNYPNPFNPITNIEYSVRAQHAVPQHVNLSIYNLLGQKVATLVNKKQSTGRYNVEWDASGFSSGIYVYQLTAKGQEQKAVFTKKLILLK